MGFVTLIGVTKPSSFERNHVVVSCFVFLSSEKETNLQIIEPSAHYACTETTSPIVQLGAGNHIRKKTESSQLSFRWEFRAQRSFSPPSEIIFFVSEHIHRKDFFDRSDTIASYNRTSSNAWQPGIPVRNPTPKNLSDQNTKIPPRSDPETLASVIFSDYKSKHANSSSSPALVSPSKSNGSFVSNRNQLKTQWQTLVSIRMERSIHSRLPIGTTPFPSGRSGENTNSIKINSCSSIIFPRELRTQKGGDATKLHGT